MAPCLLSQNLSVGNVTTLLGQNVGDLRKARSHPTISSWLRSLNTSALGELGLDTDPASPPGPARPTTGTPSTTPGVPYPAPTSGQPGNDAPASGMPRPTPPSALVGLPHLPRATEDPGFSSHNLILLLPWVTSGGHWPHSSLVV